jgi:protein-tyrosine phosphatase
MTPSGLVDVHSHVVPSGDDGAASIEEGLELCRIALEAGTDVLFATPHAHAPWDSFPRTAERDELFDVAFAAMRETVSGWGLDLRRGWEVFPTEIATGDPVTLTLQGTRAVLVEFPGSWLEFEDPVAVVVEAADLLEAIGLTPVLAHPERCRAVAAQPEQVRPLAERGWLLCLNAPSLLGGHGAAAEETAWALLDKGLVSLVASDAHRVTRPPRLDDAFRAVAERYGDAAALPLFDGSALPWI